MIEIRELIIRTNVTQKSLESKGVIQSSGSKKDVSAMEELLKGLDNKNER
ncbi:MAG: hypothetical protein R8G66_05655 [Cytophagales bacterium]|nr:hypothetical protein [Cytophagales bacterium]